MASVAHLAAGAVCGAVYARATGAPKAPSVVAFAALAVAPDLDLLAPYLGIDARGTPIEHRVMTHSFSFALVLGLLIGAMFGGRSKLALIQSSAGALASHGCLDALTNNHPAPALFWPLTDRPIQSAWTPIPGTNAFQEYFELAVFPIVSEEALWSLPMLAATYLIVRGRRDFSEKGA